MKTNITFFLAAVLAAGIFTTYAQSSAVPSAKAASPLSTAAPAPAATTPATGLTTEASAVPAASAAHPDALLLHFRGAPLESVLDYLSDAAGFIIVLDTQVHGRVDLWSDQPVTRDEAVDL